NAISLAADGTLATVSVEGTRFGVSREPRYRSNVTSMRQEDGRVHLNGWAWDRKEEVEPETVLLFRGTELLASIPAKLPRGRTVAGKRKKRPFFRLGLPATEIPEVYDPEVRVVALSTVAGVAWEIPVRLSYRRYEHRRQRAMERAAYAEGTAK
ncbi:MAG: hypothetical protein IH936_15960, partial [Acidobacteria bacterium]|nr:hypothetical protein [Acidobacteriota bacterium]